MENIEKKTSKMIIEYYKNNKKQNGQNPYRMESL